MVRNRKPGHFNEELILLYFSHKARKYFREKRRKRDEEKMD